MDIIIAGDGKVGSSLAQQLSAEGHDVTLIDSNLQVLNTSIERYDLMGVHGNCASKSVLLQAGVKEAELLIAATSADEVNLLCCTTAHGLNPNLHTIARIRNPEYTDQIYEMRDVFALSLSVNPEKQAAQEIERLLKYPGFLRRNSFAKGRAEIVELRIDSKSKLRDVSLFEMNSIIKCKVLVCAVLREGKAIAPKGNFILREGDRIFVTAPTNALATLLKNLGIVTRRVRNVILCGGGRVSYYLASLLEKDGISVQIIEQNWNRCTELAALLPNTTIIHGDGTDQDLLSSQGLNHCDALVTLTGVDELNMIMSLYGIKQNVPIVITKLSRMDNRSIIDTLSLGSVVCPKDLCCNTIIRYVRAMQKQTGAALSLRTIADGQAEAIEFLVDHNTRHCGVPLKQLKLKPDVLVAMINRGASTDIPSGDSSFHIGDSVVVVTSGRGTLQDLNDIFA
jgi:trk system potassium uptake protein TrkA